MQIYPSILEKDSDSFFTQLNQVLPHFDHIQIDITDGLFVPQKTVQIEELNAMRSTLTTSNKTFEFHLMVNDYKKEIEKLEKLKETIKITGVLIHIKALALDPSVATLPRDDGGEQFKPADNNNRWEYGIVLNPENDVSDNWETIKQFGTVQLMTVNPGQQGSPFVPEALDKIGELRQCGFVGKIILDGAMNDKTLPIVLQQKYLPDAICPGSYFKENVEDRLKTLRNILSK